MKQHIKITFEKIPYLYTIIPTNDIGSNCFIHTDIEDVYHDIFDDALEAFNARQSTNKRKIQNYYEHILSKDKLNPQHVLRITIQPTNRADMSNKLRANITKACKQWTNDFSNRNPQLVVYHAELDDRIASIILHIHMVAFATGYTRGLETQPAFDKALLQQGTLDSRCRPYIEWRINELILLQRVLISHKVDGVSERMSYKKSSLYNPEYGG